MGGEPLPSRIAGNTGHGAVNRRGNRSREPCRHERAGRQDSAGPGTARRHPAASAHHGRGARTPTTRAAIEEHIEHLEIHYLASPEAELYLALLSDSTDAPNELAAGDRALLDIAAEGIARLNQLHGPAPAGERFILLHRKRVWSNGQNLWMGWERKRGKLHELNRLLRGARDTTFVEVGGRSPGFPSDVRYVITLDADTRLPRDTARRLVGKMAPP